MSTTQTDREAAENKKEEIQEKLLEVAGVIGCIAQAIATGNPDDCSDAESALAMVRNLIRQLAVDLSEVTI